MVLRGLSDGSCKVVSLRKMQRLFWHNNIEWAEEGFTMETSQEPQVKNHPPEILDRHTKVFGKILHGVPPNKGIEHVI